MDRAGGYEEKRMNILRRAALAFAEDGYHQTTMISLAVRLGVSKPVLYYYAKNKDDLLLQCCLLARDELEMAMKQANKTSLSGMGKLRRFFTTYANVMAGDFGRCYVLVDIRTLDASTRAKESAGRRGLERAVWCMIKEGQEDGSLRACDPVLTARALFGAFNGIPRWFSPAGSLTPGDIADAYIDLFIVGMSRAPSAS